VRHDRRRPIAGWVRQLSSLERAISRFGDPAPEAGMSAGGDPRSVDEADGHARRRDIQALIAERLPLLPALRWRLREMQLGFDYPCWVDDGVIST
jgi:diacylglycerol O-acyltransferase